MLIQFIKFLELIILLIITRRFLEIIYNLDEGNTKINIYKYLFFALVIINVIVMIIILCFMILDLFYDDQKFLETNYITFIHNLFSFISSFVLFMIGNFIKSKILKTIEVSDRGSDLSYYIKSRKSDIHSTKLLDNNSTKNTHLHSTNSEIYVGIRIKQINLVTITFLICDLFEVVFITIKMYSIDDQFENLNLKTVPTTDLSATLLFLNNICILLPIISNYLAFYFIIKNNFRNNDNNESNQNKSISSSKSSFSSQLFTSRDIKRYSIAPKKEIEEFLK